jgi:hypothetical protein
VRENSSKLGDLISDFDFTQTPRKPLILPVHPKTDLIEPSRAAELAPSNGFGWG